MRLLGEFEETFVGFSHCIEESGRSTELLLGWQTSQNWHSLLEL